MKNPFKSLADKLKRKKEPDLSYTPLLVPEFSNLEAASKDQKTALVAAIEEGKHVVVYADIGPEETARYDLKDTGYSIFAERSWPSTYIINGAAARQSWVLSYDDTLALLHGLKALMEGSGMKPGEWFQVTSYAPKTKQKKEKAAKPAGETKKPAAKPKKVKTVKAKPKKRAKKGGKK